MSNFLQRSTAAGVTMSTDFSTPAQVDPFKYSYQMKPEILKRVTRYMDNGIPCLKIATPANAADTNDQSWHRRMNPAWTKDTDGFGTTPFWIQFGFQIPASRLIKWKSGAAGWKIAIIANSFLNRQKPTTAAGEWKSSNNISHVIQDTYYRGFPIMYRHEDIHTNGDPFLGAIPGVSTSQDLDLSPGWDRGPAFTNRLERYCSYSDNPRYRGCPLWPTDVWITFMVRLHTRTFGGKAGNELDFLWALPGDTKWTTLMRQRDYLVGLEPTLWPNGFNDIGLTTYETGRNGPGADTYALYRELIVSTQEIAMPSEAPVIVPTPVDCVLSPWVFDSGTAWMPAICPADGQQARIETWTRTVSTPASNGGAECGPLTEQRTATQACTFVPLPAPTPTDNYLLLEGKTYDVTERVPPPVDCVYSDWALESFILSPEICPPSGEQTRTDTWTRIVVTPASNGGAEGAPLTEIRTSTQACAYVPPPDTSPPTMPTGLAASAVTQTGLLLNWTIPTDDVGVTGYRAYRGGIQIGTPSAPSFPVVGLTPGTAYSFTVAAVDAAGNVSAQSAAVLVTTLAAVIQPPVVGEKVSVILGADGLVPESWWDRPKNTWLEVLNTKPSLLVAMLPPPPFKQWGNFAGWFQAWVGAARDPLTGRWWVLGGGHADSSINGLAEFDERTMKWRWAVTPSVWTNEPAVNSLPQKWNDGKPPAQHTYGGIVWSQRLERVLHMHWNVNKVGLYDPIAGAYAAGITASGMSNLSSVYDDETGKWFRFHPNANSYEDHHVIDMAKNTVSSLRVAKGGVQPDKQKRMTYGLTPIIVGREIICLLENTDYNKQLTAWKINLDTEAASDLLLVNPPVRKSSKEPHLFVTTGAYSPATRLIYLMQRPSGSGKWGSFITVNPVTGDCGEFTPAGPPPPRDTYGNGSAPYTRFQISSRPSGDFLELFHLSGENLRIVRLS